VGWGEETKTWGGPGMGVFWTNKKERSVEHQGIEKNKKRAKGVVKTSGEDGLVGAEKV